jgi:hypothetical protein
VHCKNKRPSLPSVIFENWFNDKLTGAKKASGSQFFQFGIPGALPPQFFFPPFFLKTAQMQTFTQSLPASPILIVALAESRWPMFDRRPDFIALLQPETELEARLLDTPEFQEGLNWGRPRFGHPEGKVGYHVREVLDNVDAIARDTISRQQLRLISLVHDVFKYREFQLGRRVKHHGLMAREFMEAHLDDPVLLDIIELHDEAFYCWRAAHLENQPDIAARRLDKLLEKIGENLPLYFDFYKCDTRTGDKIQTPLFWFEQVVASKLPA